MKPAFLCCVCREEAQEKIIKTTTHSGSDALAAWEEELNDVSLSSHRREKNCQGPNVGLSTRISERS